MSVDATTAALLQTTTEKVKTTDMTTQQIKTTDIMTTSGGRVNMTTTSGPMTTGYRTSPASNVTVGVIFLHRQHAYCFLIKRASSLSKSFTRQFQLRLAASARK